MKLSPAPQRRRPRRPGLGTTALCALLCTMLAAPAMADKVTLKSADGTVDLTGDFVAFEDNTYVIRTALGELRLSAERVRCEGDACPELGTAIADADLTIKGSDTIGVGIMPLLMEGYAGALDADAEITNTGTPNEIVATLVSDGGFGDEIGTYKVSATDSNDAFKALMDKNAKIGMASRRILPAEARALRDAGAGNMIDPAQEHIFAVDSLVVITHPSNPVDTLTTQQVAAIYAGEITNWSMVGGPDLPITVVERAADSSTREVFKEVIAGESGLPIIDGAIVAEDNNGAARAVNDNEGAIGFVGFAFKRGAKPLNLVNACGITMTPDAFSARTEEYDLQRRLFLYTRADDMDDKTKGFLQYAVSPEADAVIQKAGFIDLGIDSVEQTTDSFRGKMLADPNADPYEARVMQDMLNTMVEYDRLSTTFRFRTGSSKLDERGVVDMERLATFLEDKPEGTKVMFVGFTDAVGAFDSNWSLSQERAQQVMDQMAAFAGDRLSGIEMATTGYGEVAPSGCNDTDRGRSINRRVEVWLQLP